MECRDWLATLWSASFKGVPFYFESDDEEGGRGLVIHKFPNRDDPFVEDLGEEPRFYSGAAYVHGDNVDSLESSLKQALASRGAGTLVVPLAGPVIVHCQTFKRHHEKDKLGFVAFEIKFVRQGAATSLISVGSLLNSAFGAADTLAGAIARTFSTLITSKNEVDYVVAAAVDGIASAAASLDVTRATYRVDPGVSATVRDAVERIIEDAPAAISVDETPGDASIEIAQTLVATTRALADAMPPEAARRAMLELASIFEPPQTPAILTPVALRAYANAAAAAQVARLAALTAYAEAMLRAEYKARPDGVAARAAIAERFEAELFETTGAVYAELYVAIDDLRARVIDYLSHLINDLAPIITVETPRILPALYLAYRLYADPLRDDELIARNRVRHPAFMPRVISALSR